jgi:hypothetical protein
MQPTDYSNNYRESLRYNKRRQILDYPQNNGNNSILIMQSGLAGKSSASQKASSQSHSMPHIVLNKTQTKVNLCERSVAFAIDDIVNTMEQ